MIHAIIPMTTPATTDNEKLITFNFQNFNKLIPFNQKPH